MTRFLVPVLAASAAFGAEPVLYELSGRMVPRMGGYVSLFGVDSPFAASTLVDPSGRFHFKKLRQGAYTLSVFSRRRGEARRSIDIGPAGADRKGRVTLTLKLAESDFELADLTRLNLVSTRQLAVPESALRDYREAQRELSRHDAEAARKRLEHAVDLAPQFAEAWNSLGVIAYQTRKYDRAEECFRKAVEQDPRSFEGLVNLGGVLLTERKLDEALDYNLQAVLARPNDALANAQLGMTYVAVGQQDLAIKYLKRTRELDPAHFTHPQLTLFEIHISRGDRNSAADDLEDFLQQHPDWPEAARFRNAIAELRAPSR